MSTSQPLRRSRRGRKQAYGPGDRVEILRDEGVAIGRLVRKVDHDEGEGTVEHWIVSLDGESGEEEVTEKYIGRLVESSDTESLKGDNAPSFAVATRNDRSGSKNSNKVKRSNLTGRYERVRSTRPSTRSTRRQNGSDEQLLKTVKNIKKISKKTNKPADDSIETVVKVKMLTGTLYLYRGDKPRAEFIRTV
mmetsp:Transcript_22255/g.32850  ORF Transcript_22255/g.32850 Transcript_22255/m.32850 type:complete len:192 (+) Transcript_22255:161-736(+)